MKTTLKTSADRREDLLHEGDTIIDRYGRRWSVRYQVRGLVYLTTGEWVHRSNCWRVPK